MAGKVWEKTPCNWFKCNVGGAWVWKMMVLETFGANRGANLIAKSVTGDLRLQSYVAMGPPSCLSVVEFV
uniref:Uncharacterized protein T1E3_10 n=1 Tax=Arabidopsis thaliana TaxID=3702 RepID=Q9LZ32_ARATH|nr:putative protein [Arabidopsis thaliana]